MDKTIKRVIVGEAGQYFFLHNDMNMSTIYSIKEEWKNIGPGEVLVYRCYGKDNDLLHEISGNNPLTISYE